MAAATCRWSCLHLCEQAAAGRAARTLRGVRRRPQLPRVVPGLAARGSARRAGLARTFPAVQRRPTPVQCFNSNSDRYQLHDESVGACLTMVQHHSCSLLEYHAGSAVDRKVEPHVFWAKARPRRDH